MFLITNSPAVVQECGMVQECGLVSGYVQAFAELMHNSFAHYVVIILCGGYFWFNVRAAGQTKLHPAEHSF
jgi:hypothetical protein